MDVVVLEATSTRIRAGYACPCGCNPSVAYDRGAATARDACCCGNHFAVGPDAAFSLTPTTGFHLERQPIGAPWGETIEAAWLVGPSTHDEPGHHAHDLSAQEAERAEATGAVDPVCGMTVNPDTARAKGLHGSFEGNDYLFCGKGCMLEFRDDPEKYLEPGYTPSM